MIYMIQISQMQDQRRYSVAEIKESMPRPGMMDMLVKTWESSEGRKPIATWYHIIDSSVYVKALLFI
ncbi:hypothetical protein SRHO_G00314780 [Serrasalmus rhombeus]